MADLRILLLGAPIINYQGTSIVVDTRKAIALIAYLAVKNSVVSRDTLTALLWPDYDEESARASLRRTLSVAHRALGKEWLCADQRQVAINQAPGLYIDVVHFLSLIDKVCTAGASGNVKNANDAQALIDTIGLYRDRFLAGFSLKDSLEFDNWQNSEAEYIEQKLYLAFDELTAYQMEHQESTVATSLKHWLQLDPLHESARFRLIQHYALSGQRAAALQQYKEYALLLNEELGIMPLQETTDLYESILQNDFRPNALYSPPVNGQPAEPCHNLPVYTRPFIGRQSELQTLAAQLEDPLCRIITIVGPSGIGKTRLAVEAARAQLSRFRDGIFLVDLQPSTSLDVFIIQIADAVGFSFYRRDSLQKQLFDYLYQKDGLLILDNFEGCLDYAALISDLLRAAPRIKLLIASHECLNIHEERLVHLRGLELPGEETPDSEAVHLFIECARCTSSTFAATDCEPAIAQICRILEGIPLAIEMAAHWIELLSCEEICHEIQNNFELLTTPVGNVPVRHTSLRAAFEYSWNLLPDHLKNALQLLGIFENSFTRQAASEITAVSLEVLAQLIQRSMLWNLGQGRYSIPRPLRRYVQEKPLDADSAAQIAERHSLYYANLFTAEELNGPRQQDTLQKVRQDLGNILAGWDWAIQARHLDCLERYCQPLFVFYETFSQFSVGKSVFAEALSTLEHGKKPSRSEFPLWGKLSNRLGLFYIHLAEYDQAQTLLFESMELHNQCNNYSEIGFTANALGILYLMQGQHPNARQQFNKSLDIYEELRETYSIAKVLNNLGILANHQSDYAKAAEFLQRSLQIFRSVGNSRGMAAALNNLGNATLAMNDLTGAESFFTESQQIRAGLGDDWGVACCLMNLGQIAKDQHNPVKAQQTYSKSLDIAFKVGKQSGIANALGALGMLAFEQQNYPGASRQLIGALRLALEVGARVTALETLKNIAIVLLTRGHASETFQILNTVVTDPSVHKQTKQEAEKLLRQIALPTPATHHDTLEEIREKVSTMSYIPLIPLFQDLATTRNASVTSRL